MHESEITDSDPTDNSAGLKPRYEAPGDLWVDIRIKRSDESWVSEALPTKVVQSWPCGSHAAGELTALPLILLHGIIETVFLDI